MAQTAPTDQSAEPADLQACIDLCLECSRTCLQMATNMCLKRGGRHAEATHITLMIGCAEICRVAAEFMIMNSKLHNKVCGACAEVCEACAVSCGQLDDMEECVDICRRCAVSCRRMAIGTSAEV